MAKKSEKTEETVASPDAPEAEARVGMSITVRPRTKELVEELSETLNLSASRMADILMMEGYEARLRKGNLYAPLFHEPKKK